MSVSTRSPRGCLTCKQRRKKCDETRPTCQRCKQGKFKCLGYGHLDSPQLLPTSLDAKPKEKPDTPLFSYKPMLLPSSDARGLPPSSKASPAPATPTIRPQSSLDRPAEIPERRRSQSAALPVRPAQHPGSVPRILRVESEQINKVAQLVLSQLSRLGYRIFMPGPIQPEAAITRRVYRSDLLRWCMFLGAQIAQALLDGPHRRNFQFLDLIRHFHRQVVSDSPLSLGSDLTTRLGAALDLALYSFMVSDSATSYSIFKNTTPLWYRFAQQIPPMWSSGSTVALAYAISVPRYEISKFILWDIIYALVFGIPPILQYDTTYSSTDIRPTPLEWVYGCPLPFVILLAKINASRATSVLASPHDWQHVEMCLKQWGSRPTYEDRESCKAVARFAVQESWRQALYIYLYMGMCGANSADPRVAASVRQIVRLSSTIEATNPLGIHLFVPCLIAGTAARAEHHRAALRMRIYASREANSWILRGADFVSVLDHLWHGAAYRGRPVKWEDYVHSSSPRGYNGFGGLVVDLLNCARSMKQKRLPGPAGTSCLTCKRRRKKCDQGRPICQRCAEGGHDCLGYDHIQHRKNVKSDLETNQYGPMKGVVHSSYIGEDSAGLGSDHQLSANINSQYLALLANGPYETPFSRTTGLINSEEGLPNPPLVAESCLALAAINNPPWDQSPQSSPNPSSEPDENSSNPLHVSNRHNFNFLMTTRTTQTLSTLSPSTRQLIGNVLDLYERVLDTVYFRPKHRQAVKMREMVVTRIQASSITRCAIILVVKMVESMLSGESHRFRVTFKQSVDRFESQLQRVKARHPNPVEVQYLLNGLLEATFLKMRISNGSHVYQLLRNAAPTFLQLVHSDPNLWPDPHGPPVACLSKIAASTRFELGLFALTDIVCGMTYGLPQIVDYETATPFPEPDIHPVQFVLCCPLEFQLCIAEMNQRCSRSYVSPDWHKIEHRLLSYKAPPTVVDSTESWKTVAQLAVVESWRQAVCGVSSDDPRVQSAVRQTFQLFKTVKREEPPKINVHFMVQYLIAGACTRNESQRAFARERLLDAFDNECWILPGSELVPVLDHLWHGAAANGRAFKWSDYITSRQVALPIII